MFVPSFFGKRPKKRSITVTTQLGNKKIFSLRVNKPRKCRAPRRVCIKCQIAVLHRNSRYYTSKICEECTRHPADQGPPAPDNPGADQPSGLTCSKIKAKNGSECNF